MTLLTLGLVLFFLPHLLRELGLRERLLATLPSEGAYKGLYSLVALAGLGLIVYGKAQAPFQMVWQPLFAYRWLSHLIMLPAFILVAAGNLPPSYLRHWLRHPMLLGVLLWGLAHLWANGDLASLLLFGSFALWSAVKFLSLSRRRDEGRRSPRFLWDLVAAGIGCLAYLGVFIFHGHLFGVGLVID